VSHLHRCCFPCMFSLCNYIDLVPGPTTPMSSGSLYLKWCQYDLDSICCRTPWKCQTTQMVWNWALTFMIYSLLWWMLDKISMLGRTTNFHALPVWRHGYIDFLEVLISSVCPTPRECSEECSALSRCFFVLKIAPFIHHVQSSLPKSSSPVVNSIPPIT